MKIITNQLDLEIKISALNYSDNSKISRILRLDQRKYFYVIFKSKNVIINLRLLQFFFAR